MNSRLRRIRSKAGGFAVNALLLAYSVFNVLPVFWMVLSSLKTEQDYQTNVLAFPQEIRLANYYDVIIGAKLHRYIVNTAINVLVVVPVALFFVFVVGYLLSRFQFRGRNLIYGMFMLGIFLPMHALLVPLYLEFSSLNLLDRRYTLWLPLIAFSIPMSVFVTEGFIKTIPISVEEAAYADGANFPKRLLYVVMPMCAPVLSTSLILIFISVWNEFALSYPLLQRDEYRTISYAVKLFEGLNAANLTLQLTALVVASLPVIILYLLFTDQIISGMVTGAVKG
jgi:raffinose/stachyose/melibiose transport system permease protein